MLRELRAARLDVRAELLRSNFRLTRRGVQSYCPLYRFADASDSEPACGDGTDVRAGRGVHRTLGAASFGAVSHGTVHGPASRSAGACEGSSAIRRRREGPEEIGAARQRRLLGAFSRPVVSRPRADAVDVAPAVYRPAVRDALLDDLDPLQHDAVTRAPRRSRSSPRPARARPACSRAASRTASASSASRPATCSRSRSPARPRASSSPASSRLGVDGRSPPAPSTRSRSPSSAATPPSATGRRRRSSTARPACSGRCSAAGARRRRSRSPTSRPRSSGPRRA